MDEVEPHSAWEKCAKHLEPFETELMEYTSYVDTTTIKSEFWSSENSVEVKIVVEKPHCDDLE